jgi:hypothetical protein
MVLSRIEIKPFNADNDDIEVDRTRISEITKKQLNRRMSVKSTKIIYIDVKIQSNTK